MTFPPEHQRNISIAAVLGAVHPSNDTEEVNPPYIVLSLSLNFHSHSRYLPYIWYRPSLEHWLFIDAIMSLILFPGWGQRSLSRMILMLKYLVKVNFDSFEVLALYLSGTFP